jgi:TonB family protein
MRNNSWKRVQRVSLVHFLFVFAVALFFTNSSADDIGQDEGFAEAWQAYSEAVESGRASRILETSQAVAEIAGQLFPETDPRLAKILQNYGVALRRSSKKSEASEVLGRSLQLMENIHGRDSIELVPVIADLADAHSSSRSSDQQLDHYRRAMKIVRKHHGKQSTEYADIAFRAATSTFNFSRSLAGRRYLRDAQEIYRARLDAGDQKLGLTSLFLGKMAFADRNTKQAAAYLEEALTSFGGDSDRARQSRLATHALLVQIYETRGESDLATAHSIAIGRDTPADSDQDYLPIFRPRPDYPSAMLRRRIEGFVDVVFTVSESGRIENARVIQVMTSDPQSSEESPASDDENESFSAAALAAVKRFRYAPRFENGVAVPVENVKSRINFKLVK